MNKATHSITLLLSLIVVASSLIASGLLGIVVAIIILIAVDYIRSTKSMRKTIIDVLVILICVLFLSFFFVNSPRDSSQHLQCLNNLKQITLAILNYENEHGSLPPPYVTGHDSKPWHSWRVLLLASLDRLDLYEQYNFNEPWNGPNNSKLTDILLRIYRCPSDRTFGDAIAKTNYFAIVGSDTVWQKNKKIKLSDISDGTDKTILLVEMPNLDINWIEPRDINLEEILQQIKSKSSNIFASHTYDPGFLYKPIIGANVAFADGNVRFLSQNFLSKNLKALCTKDAGDVVDLYAIEWTLLDWNVIVALIVLVISTVLLIFWLRYLDAQNLPQVKNQ